MFYATGKRKTSIARVYMSKTSGKGKFIVNNQPINKYFGRETSTMIVNQPLETLSIKGKFNFKVSVKGGGDTGQAGAIRLGITRALMKYDQDLRPELRAAGFVTRDSRIVERKKVGHKKARKNEQYSKR